MITVRQATVADVCHIVRMGRAFWAAIPHTQGIVYCPDSLAATCGEMLSQDMLIYACDGAKPVGAVGGLCCPLFANRDHLIAAELFWWVEPEYRDSGIGRKLLAAFENAAIAAGAISLSMMAVQGLETEKAEALYQKCGYSPTEKTWSKSWL